MRWWGLLFKRATITGEGVIYKKRGDVSLLKGGLLSKRASLLARGSIKKIFYNYNPLHPTR